MTYTTQKRRLWRVIGWGKSGAIARAGVRADTHAAALERAAQFGFVRVRDCVLVQESQP